MQLDFNIAFRDLSGKEMKQNDELIMLNELLAQAIANTRDKLDLIKFFDWAIALNKSEIIDLDKSDQNTLKNFIENNVGLALIARKRLLEVFDHAANNRP